MFGLMCCLAFQKILPEARPDPAQPYSMSVPLHLGAEHQSPPHGSPKHLPFGPADVSAGLNGSHLR